MSPGSIVFIICGRLGLFGNFWYELADQSPLEDQDKQQISFFVICFTVKYADQLVATVVLKFSTSMPMPEGFGICHRPVTAAL